MNFNSVPSLQDLKTYSVNRSGMFEAVRESIYDTQTYAGAGQSVLTFFQNPIGQSGKTRDDTNMETGGALPSPQYFLIESIELLFFPAGVPSTDGGDMIDDMNSFIQNGNAILNIGSKDYLREAPLGRFPPKTRLSVDIGGITTAAYASATGRPYMLTAPLLLIPNQNFSLQLKWDGGAVAMPSGNPGTVVAVLDGLKYRESQ